MIPTEQQQIILNENVNSVIIASPGSGKTFVLSQKIKQDLSSLLDYQGVIAISYTNKASNELKGRSLSNGEDPKCSFFGTIDKFNLSEIIIPFAKQLFGIPVNVIKVTKISSLSSDEQNLFAWFNRNFRSDELTNEYINTLSNYFHNGLILIETIGLFANYVFSNSVACRNFIKARYVSIYIDEYQDSGFEQHQLFIKIMSLGIKAIAVGDLNQSIFAFSGKDAKYLKELTLTKSFKHFKLDKNHRCHPSIINYSNYLLDPSTELIPIDQNQIMFIRIEGDEISMAEWIDKKINDIKRVFNFDSLNKCAILTRGNRTGDILNSHLQTPHRLFLNNELDINLNIWSAIFSNLLHFLFDKSFRFIDVIEVFTSYERFNNSQLNLLKIHKDNIERISKQTPLDLDYLKMEFIEVANIIAPNLRNEESIELLDQVLNNQFELNSYKPSDLNDLNIMTLHKSKGLEFDVIIHTDLYEWVFPTKLPGKNNDFNNPIYADWDQDLNLHYVGLTRAKKGCILLSSTKRTNNQNKIKNAKDSEFLHVNEIHKLRYISKKN